MGHFFLKTWYLYASTFKFQGSIFLPKPNLSTPCPPPLAMVAEKSFNGKFTAKTGFLIGYFMLLFLISLTLKLEVLRGIEQYFEIFFLARFDLLGKQKENSKILLKVKESSMFVYHTLSGDEQARSQDRIWGGAETPKSGPFKPQKWTF